MAMDKFTVDTTNKLFIAKSGVTEIDVQTDLYSDAKGHWITDNTAIAFDFPIRAVGGDPIGPGRVLGTTYFLVNGWRIRPDEVSHRLVVTGNLYVDGGLDDPFVDTLGDFTVRIQLTTSNLIERLEDIPKIKSNTNLIPALL